MNSWLDFLLLSSLIIEVFFLAYIEIKAWKTIYTPLNFLMIPYMAVLFITLCVAGSSWGFVEFYYPSLIIWNVGLLLFAIPSYVLAYVMNKRGFSTDTTIKEEGMPKILIVFSIIFSLLFIWHLKSVLGSSEQALGSDKFGEDFSGGGLWGHLRIFILPLLMASIYYVSKKNWWLWFPIIVFVAVCVLNQVKSWAIIPCVGAFCIRLYTGRTKLTMRFVITAVLGTFLAFFSFYAMSILVVNQRTSISDEFWTFMIGHFLHYLTSGTLGWSMDVQAALPDDVGSLEVILSPLINLGKTVVGDDELISPVNRLFFNSGITQTNVRTIFGTLYLNTTVLSFAAYIIVLSTICYSIRIVTMLHKNIYTYIIYFFVCALLFMGWFEFYFFHLIVFELPVIVACIWFVDKFILGYRRNSNLLKQ